jgi:predicted ArsR family transcriptional regulator
MPREISSNVVSGREDIPGHDEAQSPQMRGNVKPDLDARLDRLASLAEPVRRALYRFVVAQRTPISREQAAKEVGVAHHVAKFNLDRLVEDGLLEAEYRRPPGRGGPGAGRPAKLYRRAEGDVEVSLPERRYDLAGRLLARALARVERTDRPVRETLQVVAHEAGRDAGKAVATAAPRPARRKVTERVVAALAEQGFEPFEGPDGITLANCPFHALADEETDLVCGMNLALIEGVLDGVGATKLCAELDPEPPRCCVRIRKR